MGCCSVIHDIVQAYHVIDRCSAMHHIAMNALFANEDLSDCAGHTGYIPLHVLSTLRKQGPILNLKRLNSLDKSVSNLRRAQRTGMIALLATDQPLYPVHLLLRLRLRLLLVLFSFLRYNRLIPSHDHIDVLTRCQAPYGHVNQDQIQG